VCWDIVVMEPLIYGRKVFSFAKGITVHQSTTITERSFPHESEKAFTHRLMKKYGDRQGTVEIVIKNGHPDYAVITFPEND
ncbi:MAG: hypothetical protein P8183_23725, partial [Anaerolineae bacterium]